MKVVTIQSSHLSPSFKSILDRPWRAVRNIIIEKNLLSPRKIFDGLDFSSQQPEHSDHLVRPWVDEAEIS